MLHIFFEPTFYSTTRNTTYLVVTVIDNSLKLLYSFIYGYVLYTYFTFTVHILVLGQSGSVSQSQ